MKKLLISCLLILTLCACEAPDRDKETAVSTESSEQAQDHTGSSEKDMPGPTATPTPVVSDIPDGGGNMIDMSGTNVSNYEKGRELFCLASSEQEAMDIAAQYGISFVEYSLGVATFTTNEDPAAVIQRGKDKGLKALEINYTATIQ